jgi:hypothetical protein
MFQIDACMQLSLPGFGGSTGTLPGLALGRPWLELQVNLVASFNVDDCQARFSKVHQKGARQLTKLEQNKITEDWYLFENDGRLTYIQ